MEETLTSSSDHLQSTKWSPQCSLDRFLAAAGLVVLVFHSAGIAYRARHDPSELAFIAFAYSDLALLFACLKRFERMGPDGAPEAVERLKAAVWASSAALNLAFAWRVARAMPTTALAVSVWMMATVVVVGGFYGLFMRPVDAGGKVNGGRGYSTVENRELEPEEKV
ncbi:uncharacterized protein LOC141834136 [Curcuma longa]|uniref:uncharacterized protein LOC141834136 n=1 Tax=Curcuma longa TaxID=136217 RepID=UPI003D9ECE8F